MTLNADSSERLDKFLARSLDGISRSRIVEWIESGHVWVGEKLETKPAHKLSEGDVVRLDEVEDREAHDLTPADIDFDVMYETDDLLVVNKPRGLAVHPASSLDEPSLVNGLLGRNIVLSGSAGDFRPGIVHRLDKDTTGLLLVAKNDRAHEFLSRHIAEKKTERRYLAIVEGNPPQELFTIDAPIGRDEKNRLRMAVTAKGKPARTHVAVLQKLGRQSLLGIRLETGRTHQIRVHLRAVNFPVVGDSIYGKQGTLMLHAAYLEFDDPTTGERRTITAGTPDDFGTSLSAEQAREALAEARFNLT